MYVFRRGAGVWTLLSKVRAAAPASDDWYGAAIAVSGNTCLVGAPFNEDAGYHAGTAYLNEFGSGTWVESRQLFASDGTDFDDFGQHVALSGNTAAVATPKNALTPGAPGSANGEGAVYVFERDLGGSNHWGEAMLLTTQDPNTPQGFGSSIALEGDRLLVGAPSARGDEIGTVEGLAFDPDTSTLYGVETTSDRLVTIHAASGAATPVGPLGFGHVAGLAFDTISDTLYGTDDSSDVLLTIDTTTGAAIPVGLLGFGQVEALAFDPLGGVLYGADAVSDKLIAIDTATGAGTAIGSFGFPSPNQDVDGLAFDPASGTLYGTRAPTTSPNDHRLVTIDTATGAGTVVGSTGMTNVLGLAHAESAGLLGAKGPGNLLVELDSTTGNGTAIGPFSTFEAGVGAVFVFQRDAGGHDAWGQVARISPPNAGAKDYFGTEVVAVSADTLVGGASSDAAGGPNAGAAYVLRLSASAPSYCTAGTSSAGCQALLSGTGSPSASASNGFWIAATGVEGRKDGILFFGSNGRQANAWGNGSSFHCVVPPVKRGGLLSGVGTFGRCDGAFLQDLNALWCATCPKPNVNPGAGTVVQAQLWYRDPQNTSNQTTSLSDALEFPVGP